MRCAMSPATARKDHVLPVISSTDFKHPVPFAFVANASGQIWTPASLDKELGVRKFGNLARVHALVNGSNLEEVASLVEWWTQYKFPVGLVFPSFAEQPTVGTKQDPYPFGLGADEVYHRRGRRWYPTTGYIEEVTEFFAGYRDVSVDQCSN